MMRASINNRSLHKQYGFTLLELSVTVAVLGLILAIYLKMASERTDTVAYRALNAQLDQIEDAIYSYRAAYNSLPCPSDPTLAPTSQYYAWDRGAAGVCTTNANLLQYPAGTATHYAGDVPVRTLGLPDSMAIDPWGHKLRYAVKLDATASNAFTTNLVTAAWPTTSNLFTVYDESGITTARADGTNGTTGALYVLISFGKNGHGAYMVGSSTRYNGGSTNTQELANCACDTSAAAASPSLNLNFYQQPITPNPTNPLNSFDDVVRFKTRALLATPTEAQ